MYFQLLFRMTSSRWWLSITLDICRLELSLQILDVWDSTVLYSMRIAFCSVMAILVVDLVWHESELYPLWAQQSKTYLQAEVFGRLHIGLSHGICIFWHPCPPWSSRWFRFTGGFVLTPNLYSWNLQPMAIWCFSLKQQHLDWMSSAFEKLSTWWSVLLFWISDSIPNIWCTSIQTKLDTDNGKALEGTIITEQIFLDISINDIAYTFR